MSEVWKAVVGFEGRYEVSDLGNVRSIRYRGGLRRTPKALKAIVLETGYLRVNLSVDGVIRGRMIAHLVAEAFIGPRPPGTVVCHCDGNRTNNVATNLRYDTSINNVRDKVLHGTSFHGQRNPASKLSNEVVAQIKKALERGVASADIQSAFGIDRFRLSSIRRGATWATVGAA